MLSIKRKRYETFYIFPDDLPPDMTVAELFKGGKIAVTVKKITRSEVSLVIHAPRALKILRDDTRLPLAKDEIE